VAIAIVVVALFAIVMIVSILRARCPACRRPALEPDCRLSRDGREAGTGAKMFQCAFCLTEFRRLDRGPLVRKSAWDAGARDELPRARVLRR
jgi:hypothetical protein